MATISENLQTLNEAKQAIKAAIENKGQDLTDVPFTQYAEKIEAIESGSSSGYTLGKYLKEKSGQECVQLFNNCKDLTDEDLKQAFKECPDFSLTNPNYTFYGCEKLTEIPYFDMSKSTKSLEYTFAECKNLEKLPPEFDTRNVTVAPYATFNNCISLKEAPFMDFSNCVRGNCFNMFGNCKSLKTVPCYNFGTVTEVYYFVTGCDNIEVIPAIDLRYVTGRISAFLNKNYALREVWVKNISLSFEAGGSNWGHLLTVESLIHLIKELRDRDTLLTLTIGTVNLEKLANVYVRTIPVTDEMRAEDDLIDEKLPFELCESTDEGAMLIADYVSFKNWQLR